MWNRLAGTVGTVLPHQLKQPGGSRLAGQKWVLERTKQTDVLLHTGLGSQSSYNQQVVHLDDVRAAEGRGVYRLGWGGYADAGLRSSVHPVVARQP